MRFVRAAQAFVAGYMEVERLRKLLRIALVRQYYREIFGQETRSSTRQSSFRRIVGRLQILGSRAGRAAGERTAVYRGVKRDLVPARLARRTPLLLVMKKEKDTWKIAELRIILSRIPMSFETPC